MALFLSASTSPLTSNLSLGKTCFRFSPKHGRPSIAHSIQPPFNSNADLNFQTLSPLNPLLTNSPLSHAATRVSSHGFLDKDEKDDILPVFEERPVKFVFWVLVWASVSLAFFAASGDANAAAAAAADSIRASSFGLKIASALRGSGWPDEAVVFALATLPVIELRGAIPVGYWLQLKPVMLTVLSVLGPYPSPGAQLQCMTRPITFLSCFVSNLLSWNRDYGKEPFCSGAQPFPSSDFRPTTGLSPRCMHICIYGPHVGPAH
ncbi:hypothetical protein GBA52_002986 [Prunus armeniaca]|nr:hypothetical protein GBA52_002986 [Prunus armeniaca]